MFDWLEISLALAAAALLICAITPRLRLFRSRSTKRCPLRS
jgi:hypothetical protein